jgi:hypothetical protein
MTKPSDRALSLPLWQRIGWFSAIWAGSVVALSIVAWILKWAVKTPM